MVWVGRWLTLLSINKFNKEIPEAHCVISIPLATETPLTSKILQIKHWQPPTERGDGYISTSTDDDLFFAGEGANIIQSSLGNDVILSGSGDSVIDSGPGDDRVYVEGGRTRFVLNAGEGSVTIYGFAADAVS